MLSISKCFATLQNTQFIAGYYTGKYISIDEDYLEGGIFTPWCLSNCYTPFFDIRGYRFNDGRWAASAGLGLRRSLSAASAIGLNTYYDYRRGEKRHDFHQMGVGFEWLNCCLDFRMNGYFPFSRKSQTSEFCVFDQLGDGFFATKRRIEFAYSGFDAEVGTPLWGTCNFNLYAAAGPYYYCHSHDRRFWGGYGRIALDWNSVLSFQVRTSYDHFYRGRVQGIFQILFPFKFFCCGWNACRCGCWINQQVWRNRIILTDRCCNWRWNWNDRN